MVCPLRVPAMIRTAEDCLHHQLDGLALRESAQPHEPAPGVEVEREVECSEPPAAPYSVRQDRVNVLHRAEPESKELAGDRVDLRVAQDVSEHLLVARKERVQLGQTDSEPFVPVADEEP